MIATRRTPTESRSSRCEPPAKGSHPSAPKLLLTGIVVMVTWLVLAAPDDSYACAVCFSAREDNRLSFIFTTAFLTCLPLLAMGGAVLWLRARWRELEADSSEPDAPGAVAPAEPR